MVQQILLVQGCCVLVDDNDYEKLRGVNWHLTARGYVAGRVKTNGVRQRVYLHRYLLDAQPDQFVDHMDGDRLNNTRANLRLVTRAQNQWNRKVQVGDDVREFHIATVFTYDEPVGGLINRAVDDHLQQDEDITSGEILVIDIGGGTTSIVACNPNARVDYDLADSFTQGIIDVMDSFEKAFRQRYWTSFAASGSSNRIASGERCRRGCTLVGQRPGRRRFLGPWAVPQRVGGCSSFRQPLTVSWSPCVGACGGRLLPV
jgi:hypothetical protein